MLTNGFFLIAVIVLSILMLRDYYRFDKIRRDDSLLPRDDENEE